MSKPFPPLPPAVIEFPSRSEGLAYVQNPAGHRRAYVQTLGRELALEKLIAPRSVSTFMSLVSARHILFATIEDDIPWFIAIAITRALRGRRTVAVLMNPGRCFETGAFKYTAKRWAFELLNRVPQVRLLSILPFYLDDRFSKVAADWIYDPEFWDLENYANAQEWPTSKLADDVVRAAAGRPIILYLGSISQIKGFDFLVEIMRIDPSLAQRAYIVAAGPNYSHDEGAVTAFREAGGHVETRYLTSEEVISLKRKADLLWACYHPSYNSSSGIFGRAMQLSKHVIVRQGSYLERIAEHLEYPVQACPFGEAKVGALLLSDFLDRPNGRQLRRDIGAVCKQLSVNKLKSDLRNRGESP